MRYIYLLLGIFLLAGSLQAQVSAGVNFNIGSQPVWGPTGYDHVDYYYLPDIESYYNVHERRFYYFEGGRWVGRSSLPTRYRHYDFYNSYKVVVNDPKPYNNHEKYRDQYASYKGRHDQQPIRDSHDSKYFVNRNHPEHNNWVKAQQREKNKGRAESKVQVNSKNRGRGDWRSQGNKKNENTRNEKSGKGRGDWRNQGDKNPGKVH